jgi:hypothetical protein
MPISHSRTKSFDVPTEDTRDEEEHKYSEFQFYFEQMLFRKHVGFETLCEKYTCHEQEGTEKVTEGKAT